jgi:hypothetical protein
MLKHINRRKFENHNHHYEFRGKTFNKIQHLFMIKFQNTVAIESLYLNITKAIGERPNNIPNDEKLKVFPLISGTR